MSLNLVNDIKKALAQLNPADVRKLSERSISIGIAAASEDGYAALEQFLTSVGPASFSHLHRVSANSALELHDLVLCHEDSPCPDGAFFFSPGNANLSIERVLDAKPDLRNPAGSPVPCFPAVVF